MNHLARFISPFALLLLLLTASARAQTSQPVTDPDPLKAINLLRTELVDAFGSLKKGMRIFGSRMCGHYAGGKTGPKNATSANGAHPCAPSPISWVKTKA